MVALSVILFPPLLIAFLLVMERVEEPLRRPASPREVAEFLNTATAGEVDTLASSGIRRALFRWRRRRAAAGRRPTRRSSERTGGGSAEATRSEGGRRPPTDRVTDGTAA